MHLCSACNRRTTNALDDDDDDDDCACSLFPTTVHYYKEADDAMLKLALQFYMQCFNCSCNYYNYFNYSIKLWVLVAWWYTV